MRPQVLRLTGRLADGWGCPLNIYVPPEQVPASQAIIDQAAQRAGRAPAAIRRIYNVLGAIAAGPCSGRGLIGSVDSWAETPTRWSTALGLDTFIFWPLVPSPEQFRRFVLDVAPPARATWWHKHARRPRADDHAFSVPRLPEGSAVVTNVTAPHPSPATGGHPGDRLVQELLRVHSLIRRDLQTVRELADQVVDGVSPAIIGMGFFRQTA